jgi:hypothetical protein
VWLFTCCSLSAKEFKKYEMYLQYWNVLNNIEIYWNVLLRDGPLVSSWRCDPCLRLLRLSHGFTVKSLPQRRWQVHLSRPTVTNSWSMRQP